MNENYHRQLNNKEGFFCMFHIARQSRIHHKETHRHQQSKTLLLGIVVCIEVIVVLYCSSGDKIRLYALFPYVLKLNDQVQPPPLGNQLQQVVRFLLVVISSHDIN